MFFQVLYIIATTVVVIGFLLSLRFYKHFHLQGVATMAWLVATALLWEVIPQEYSIAMYNISFIAVTICLAKSKFIIKHQIESCEFLLTGKCRTYADKETK